MGFRHAISDTDWEWVRRLPLNRAAHKGGRGDEDNRRFLKHYPTYRRFRRDGVIASYRIGGPFEPFINATLADQAGDDDVCPYWHELHRPERKSIICSDLMPRSVLDL